MKPGERVRANKRFAYRTGEWKQNAEGNDRPIYGAVEEGALGTVESVREADGMMVISWDAGFSAAVMPPNIDAI